MRHVFLALTNPVPGKEAEFNAWYDDFHLREVVEYGSGMLAGRRFRLTADQRPGQAAPPWSYLAWYDMEHDDLADYHRQPWIAERPPLKPFAGLVADDHVGWVYTPVGDGVGAATGPDEGSGGDRFLLLVLTNDELDAFPILPAPAVGRRYRAAAEQRAGQPRPGWARLTAYDVTAQSAAAVLAATAGVFGPSQAVWLFEAIGEGVGASSPLRPG